MENFVFWYGKNKAKNEVRTREKMKSRQGKTLCPEKEKHQVPTRKNIKSRQGKKWSPDNGKKSFFKWKNKAKNEVPTMKKMKSRQGKTLSPEKAQHEVPTRKNMESRQGKTKSPEKEKMKKMKSWQANKWNPDNGKKVFWNGKTRKTIEFCHVCLWQNRHFLPFLSEWITFEWNWEGRPTYETDVW